MGYGYILPNADSDVLSSTYLSKICVGLVFTLYSSTCESKMEMQKPGLFSLPLFFVVAFLSIHGSLFWARLGMSV